MRQIAAGQDAYHRWDCKFRQSLLPSRVLLSASQGDFGASLPTTFRATARRVPFVLPRRPLADRCTRFPPRSYSYHGRCRAPALGARSIPMVPLRGTRVTPFGRLYEVVVLVDGLNGATSPVATVWLVDGDLPPRLVSTWVDIP